MTSLSVTAAKPFAPWIRIPLIAGVAGLGLMVCAAFLPMRVPLLAWAGMAAYACALVYFLVQFVARLWRKHWKQAAFAALRMGVLLVLLVPAAMMLLMASFFGPSEDHFADRLTIPAGIDIAEPLPDPSGGWVEPGMRGNDAMQLAVRDALARPGGDDAAIIPSMPSLRRASSDHYKLLMEYLDASPDWHVFQERGNRFAARRWSYNDEPRDTLHGYISEFGGESGFQTRTLLCLDRKQWNRYKVRLVKEGSEPVRPELSSGNSMHESRVMIDCGGVWVEFFEQSATRERRVTKASLGVLEAEFGDLLRDPAAAIAAAKARSNQLALRLSKTTNAPIQLLEGMQPGIYGVAYALNPGEPGSVYLKAFEVTKGTPLSEDRLQSSSETRMAWSVAPEERFAAKAGFTIYEGDWGKPYAARFEVWFRPDTGKPERKLAERIFKIEGWQR
jgi:hypothetical protein